MTRQVHKEKLSESTYPLSLSTRKNFINITVTIITMIVNKHATPKEKVTTLNSSRLTTPNDIKDDITVIKRSLFDLKFINFISSYTLHH